MPASDARSLSWGDVHELRATVPDHVVFRTFVYETVLLNIQSGQYHGLDTIGARFFEVAREAATLGVAARSLATEFEQDAEVIERDAAAFFGELAALGLVVLSRPEPAAGDQRRSHYSSSPTA